MKTLVGLIILSLFAFTIKAQPPQSAVSILAVAYANAKKENKKVLVKFSASWCGWCRKLDYSMKDSTCKKQFDDNFIIVSLITDERADKKILENKGADSLILKYNTQKNEGLPFWFILDSDGKLLADCYYVKEANKKEGTKSMIGCPATEPEVVAFIEILKRTTTLNNDDLEKIRVRFRANEYTPKK